MLNSILAQNNSCSPSSVFDHTMTSYKYIEARVGPISQHSIKLNNLSADGVCAQMGVSISINLYIKNVPVYTSVSLPVSYYKQRHCTCAFCI